MLYERIIVEATGSSDLEALLNEALPIQVWHLLYLPPPTRSRRESEFPELAKAAQPTSMDDFHEHLTRTALARIGQFGFALACGYAVQAHGFLERLTEDPCQGCGRTDLVATDDSVAD